MCAEPDQPMGPALHRSGPPVGLQLPAEGFASNQLDCETRAVVPTVRDGHGETSYQQCILFRGNP